MTTSGSNTLRGGQTVLHGFRMWGQLLRWVLFIPAVCVIVVTAWHILHDTKGYDWYAAGMVTLAEAKLTLGYKETSGQEVEMLAGRYEVMSIRDLAASPAALRARERLRDEMFASARTGACATWLLRAPSPTRSRACPSRTVPRPAIPSSPAPPDRARPC